MHGLINKSLILHLFPFIHFYSRIVKIVGGDSIAFNPKYLLGATLSIDKLTDRTLVYGFMEIATLVKSTGISD